MQYPAVEQEPAFYRRPAHGWTCFHCGETFTSLGAAAVHFGDTPSLPVGCSVDIVEYRRMRRVLHTATLKLLAHGIPLTLDDKEGVDVEHE